jgi:hypothetical protein
LTDVLPIYIGWDSREQDAYDVCRFSILNRTKAATYIRPLKHRQLRAEGLFTRPWKIDEAGQYTDERDGRPFSTEFSHSRFLTPHLARRDVPSAKWALFVDCDFLFLADVADLFGLADDRYAVMCVQHRHNPTETVKMDGVAQVAYHRKNWSSLVLFNLEVCDALSPEFVNTKPGGEMHAFAWCRDERIGALPPEWNWIQGVSPDVKPKAVHYSVNAPWFIQYGGLWEEERARMRNPRPTLWERISESAA